MSLRLSKRQEYLNLPNYLTLGRIVLIPVVMWLISKIELGQSASHNLNIGIIASIVYFIAGVSDLIDGYYARKYKINSVFGKYFDPLADKLMVLAVMIMLVPLGRIAAWVVVAFLAREITITALRGVASSEGIVLPADRWGKQKTLLQNMALVGLMVHYPVWGLDTQLLGEIVLVLALIMTLGSGMNYIYQFSRQIVQANQV